MPDKVPIVGFGMGGNRERRRTSSNLNQSGHSKEEVTLMTEYFGYKGAPGWIFMGALQEWKLSSTTVLENAKEWEAQGKPHRKEWDVIRRPVPNQSGESDGQRWRRRLVYVVLQPRDGEANAMASQCG